MKTHRVVSFFLRPLAAMLVGATPAGVVAVGGQIAGPGWRMAVGGPLPPASREYVGPKAGEAAPSPAGELPDAWSTPVNAEVVSDEIRELARGLLHAHWLRVNEVGRAAVLSVRRGGFLRAAKMLIHLKREKGSVPRIDDPPAELRLGIIPCPLRRSTHLWRLASHRGRRSRSIQTRDDDSRLDASGLRPRA